MDDQLDQLRNNEGEITSRAAEIKAKKRNKGTASGRLDVDTRITTAEDKTSKRFGETDVI
jgi:hypothetical protein